LYCGAVPQGNYSDLLVALSSVYSDLRGDKAEGKAEEASEVGRVG